MLMYSACFSTKILFAKLAQMGNFCLAKSDATRPMAQMATGSASIDYTPTPAITWLRKLTTDYSSHPSNNLTDLVDYRLHPPPQQQLDWESWLHTTASTQATTWLETADYRQHPPTRHGNEVLGTRVLMYSCTHVLEYIFVILVLVLIYIMVMYPCSMYSYFMGTLRKRLSAFSIWYC